MKVNIGSISFEVDEDTHPTRPDYWRSVNAGEWEPETLKTIASLSAGSRYIDIGAWIGPTVLTAAAAGATVVAFEPDPVARKRLERNLSLNPTLASRTTVIAAALSDRDGESVIRSSTMGNSGSSLMYNEGEEAGVQLMNAARVSREQEFDGASLIKVDIEGGEYGVIPLIVRSLRRGRPDLLLSTHVTYLGRNARGQGRLRRAATVRLVAIRNQLSLLWHLRFYKRWSIGDMGWRPVSRLEVAMLFMKAKNREFLVQA